MYIFSFENYFKQEYKNLNNTKNQNQYKKPLRSLKKAQGL